MTGWPDDDGEPLAAPMRRVKAEHRSLTNLARRRDVALEIRCTTRGPIALVTWGGVGGLWWDSTIESKPMPRRDDGPVVVPCRCPKRDHVLDLGKVHDAIPRSDRWTRRADDLAPDR